MLERRKRGPGDLPAELVADVNASLLKLATTPCEAGYVPEKFGYLLEAHKREMLEHWREEEAPALMAALDFHFGDGKQAGPKIGAS